MFKNIKNILIFEIKLARLEEKIAKEYIRNYKEMFILAPIILLFV